MKKVSSLLTLFVLGALSYAVAQGQTQSQAQVQYNPKATYDGPYKLNTWSVGVHAGPTQFYGDLREYDFWPVTANGWDSRSEAGTWHLGASLNKQLTYLFGARLDFDFGTLRGMKRRVYFAYFNSNYAQADITGTVNLKGLLFGPNKLKHFKWDAYAGAGQMWFKSTAYQLGNGRVMRRSDDSRALRNDATQLLKPASSFTSEWVIPVGMAFYYELTNNIDLGLDFRFNNVNTEKLDATIGGSTTAMFDGVDSGQLFADGISTPKGNSALDKYGYVGLTAIYKLGKNAARVAKQNGKYVYNPDGAGLYNLRYTDPKLLVKPPKILSLAEMDSIAKANKPKDIDPRLLIDTDGDGVADFFDKEPSTPSGSIVTGAGQKIDFDKYLQNCGMSTCNEIFANVLFDTDKSIIKPEFYDILNKVVEVMNKSQCKLMLTGHADRRATDRYNVGLSERRVASVKQYLTQAGLKDANRIVIDAYGSFKPVADNGSEEGLRKNRRVEIKLMQ